jgi:hypothetical protein
VTVRRIRVHLVLAALLVGVVGCGGGPEPRKASTPGPLLLQGDKALGGALVVDEAKLIAAGGERSCMLRLRNAGNKTISFGFSLRYLRAGGILIEAIPKIRTLRLGPAQVATIEAGCPFPQATAVGIRLSGRIR